MSRAALALLILTGGCSAARQFVPESTAPVSPAGTEQSSSLAPTIATTTSGTSSTTQSPELRLSTAFIDPGAGDVPAGAANPAGTAWRFGKASFYDEGAVKTANGERFVPDWFTAAHRTLRFGTRLRVCRSSGVRACVDVRVNDRGPFVAGRDLDLSRGAMRALGGLGAGVIGVRWTVLS